MAASVYNIKIEQGTTYSLRLRLTSTTLNFIGATTSGQIRKTYSDPTILASFTCTPGTDITGDYVDIQLTPVQTSAIPVASAKDYKFKSTFYTYDVEIQILNGPKIRLLQGSVEVIPEVTK